MKLLLAATIDGWDTRSPSRADQHYRNTLSEALRRVVEQIQNHGSTTGGVNWPGVSIHFKLEDVPVEKPADDEAA